MKEWLREASAPAVVKRALAYAVVVGAVLITINHGDAIVRGNVDTTRLLKMGLTVMVPYLVSTFSSVGAIRSLRRAQAEAGKR
jgi:hypothetical protein